MTSKFLALKDKIKGPVFSIVTPFKKDDSIDYDSLNNYIERIYSSGGRIFYVMAYNSRYSELSWEEIKELNYFVTSKVKKLNKSNVVIVADPLHCSTKISIDFCKHAENINADIISLIFREKFYSEKQVFSHYKKCAENSNIGILIHEMPFISGMGGHTINWPVSLLDKIANLDSVIAIKEDAKDDEYSHNVINCLKERLAIIISGGGKRQWLRFSNEGCQSWLNGIGVFEPKIPIIFYEAYKQKNEKILNYILNEIEDPFFEKIVAKYGWHIGIKACLEARNIFSRFERAPMMPIDDSEMSFVKEIMKTFDNKISNMVELANSEL
tara:strand:- start:117 stop:1094 length:978 start_codon:yes stop_codon:yes gene_type:complete